MNESISSDSVGQSADLRTRIAAVICGMDALHAKQWSLAVADTVIRELEADYILVPKGHTIARIRSAEKLGLTGDGR